VAAEALLVAAGCIGATSDSDSLRQLVLAMDGVLAGGEPEARQAACCCCCFLRCGFTAAVGRDTAAGILLPAADVSACGVISVTVACDPCARNMQPHRPALPFQPVPCHLLCPLVPPCPAPTL
jgi:hypothetical protein